MRPHTTMAVGGSKIRCGVHSLSEKFRFSPYLVRYLCPGGEAGDSKQLAFRSSPSLGGDELDMPRLLACGGPPVTARTDEDTGEPAPARSLPHTQTRAREAPDNPRLTKLCVSRRRSGSRASGNVWGSRLLIQWPLTTLLVYNLELCAEAHRLPPRLLWIALDVCGGGTRSLWSVLTAEG